MQLARLLQGKSLEVYQRIRDADVGQYDVLKVQLLKRFRLTEGGNRKKFKLSKLEVGETPDQFVDRLKRYLDKWREMAGCKDNYDDLKDMIIRDQHFLMCDKSLQTFLKEKGKLNMKDICKASNDYYDAHGYPSDNHEAHNDYYDAHGYPTDNREH